MSHFRSAWVIGGAAALCWALAWPSPTYAADPEEAQYNVVVGLYNAGQWQAAINKIEEREQLDLPEAMRSKYLYAKGLAFEKGQKRAEARAAYEQLLAKYPQAAEAGAARLAGLYLDHAAGDAAAVIAAYPKLDQAQLSAAAKRDAALMYAEALYATADHANALAAYRAAVAAGAEAAAIAGKLFDLYHRLGMHAELLEHSAGGVAGVPADLLALIRSEALLAQGKHEQVEAEAQKVPADSPHHPRASLARAQALVKLGKLAEATAPLEIAVAKLKEPPAPPAAFLALAECYLDAGRAAEVDKLLAQAATAGRTLPEAEQAAFQAQVALLRIRAAAGGDPKKLIEAITAARDTLPAEQRAALLYLRLHALSEEGDPKAVLVTMKDDYPVLQAGEEDGPATLLYARALRADGQGEQATQLLEAMIARRDGSAEALRARLALASAALEQGEHAKAKAGFDAIAAAPAELADAALGKAALDEVRYNRGVVAMKLGDPAAAAAALSELMAAAPTEELARVALPLLGQAHAAQEKYAEAEAAWTAALAAAGERPPAEEIDLRDRLARVLFAQGKHAGVIEQYAAAAELAGDVAKLPREAREVWARALFASEQYAQAAAMLAALAEQHRQQPGYAYEAAVAFEKADQPADAARWYAVAREGKERLPAPYAAAVDGHLAALQLRTGQGDLGAAVFVERAAAGGADAVFEPAAAALRKIAGAAKLGQAHRARLETAFKALPPDQPRRYVLGAIVLQSLAAEGQAKPMAALARQLAEDFARHESKLDPKSSGATLGAAMIQFFKGEAHRLAGEYADALAAYETVLAAYPYNEWPDAAACGAAECYAALGDPATALARYREVIEANAAAPADSPSVPWRDLAQQRVAQLEKGS